MSVVDHLLDSLVTYLRKTQKARKKRKRAATAKRRPPKALRKSAKPKPVRKRSASAGRKTRQPSVRRRSPGPKAEAGGVCIGEVTHFFPRIQVVVLKMTKGRLLVGDRVRVKGRGTDFAQKVASLQIESVNVRAARKGQLVGLKVGRAARAGDKVYKLAQK